MGIFEKRINDLSDIMTLIGKNSHDLEHSLDPLMDRIGDARIVLLGEASHGTHEYYLWRARIPLHQVPKAKGPVCSL